MIAVILVGSTVAMGLSALIPTPPLVADLRRIPEVRQATLAHSYIWRNGTSRDEYVLTLTIGRDKPADMPALLGAIQAALAGHPEATGDAQRLRLVVAWGVDLGVLRWTASESFDLPLGVAP